MTLRDLESGTLAVVKEVHGGLDLRRRLGEVGVEAGGTLQVLRSAALGGPVLLAVRGARVAIGQRQARRIEVDPVGSR